jgi:archaellum component FlaC
MEDNITMKVLLDKLNLIDAKLNNVEKRLDDIQGSCQKMDDHISFVDNTYETLRSPLDYFREKINQISGGNSDPLPRIKN